jgi:hypothetical protein
VAVEVDKDQELLPVLLVDLVVEQEMPLEDHILVVLGMLEKVILEVKHLLLLMLQQIGQQRVEAALVVMDLPVELLHHYLEDLVVMDWHLQFQVLRQLMVEVEVEELILHPELLVLAELAAVVLELMLLVMELLELQILAEVAAALAAASVLKMAVLVDQEL